MRRRQRAGCEVLRRVRQQAGRRGGRRIRGLSPPGEGAGAIAERRLVSVLFADLVGFTSIAEHRDPEDVRELLTRYFDTARRLIERYGGTVEKFIGDAVMAVWGAPVAQEDDAERAVRTALDLVAAVSALGDESGSAELRLRAGVMTGEAAVTLGAVGQGMVAGDLVNAASRVQALADPGAVFVDDATRRATEAAIAYEDVGLHRLKGKTTPIALHSALRVMAARRGEGRSVGLEPPFIGREREFRLVKDLFHATADEQRARLVRSPALPAWASRRLAWEFEKYIDGLADDVFWHRGRCLAYGDGIAYWALGEMVRMRARIAEDDEPEVALLQAARNARVGGPRRPRPRVPGAAPRAPDRPRRADGAGQGGSVLGLAAVLRAARGCRDRSSWCSRICSGPTPGCSTSSSTCSTGRVPTRSTC